MTHPFSTVTVINHWNNLPRDIVDSLSFKYFTSTLDTFQRDKPVSQNRCRKYSIRLSVWGLQEVRLDAYHSCSTQYLNKTVLQVLCALRTNHLMTIVSILCVQFSSNWTESIAKIHLPVWQAKWEPFQDIYGHLQRSSHAIFTVWRHHCWRPNYIKMPVSTHW